MSPLVAKVVVGLATLVMILIRAPHGRRSAAVCVATSRRGLLEAALLTVAWTVFLLPLAWMFTPALDAADFPLRTVPVVAGTGLLGAGLWLFHRSHADLGTNWSITLELREGHALVTHGVYRHVRHPMYSALLLYGLGQTLVLPNWVAGPSYLVAMTLLVALRIGPEERMMRERFGDAYDAYAARTQALVPWPWAFPFRPAGRPGSHLPPRTHSRDTPEPPNR